MKESNKDLLIESGGWLWLSLAIFGLGVYGIVKMNDIYDASIAIMALLVGGFLIWLIIDTIISSWEK